MNLRLCVPWNLRKTDQLRRDITARRSGCIGLTSEHSRMFTFNVIESEWEGSTRTRSRFVGRFQYAPIGNRVIFDAIVGRASTAEPPRRLFQTNRCAFIDASLCPDTPANNYTDRFPLNIPPRFFYNL